MTIIEEIQTILQKVVPKLKVDGDWGPASKAALELARAKNFGNPPSPPSPPISGDYIGDRNELAVSTLHPVLQPIARRFIQESGRAGQTIIITSGTRSYAEQDALYAQGRTKPGDRVTDVRGGYSSHNFGLAFDVTIFDGKNPVWESSHYRKVLAPIGKALGLSWGGDWTKPVDEPHYYLKPKWAVNFSQSPASINWLASGYQGPSCEIHATIGTD